MQRVKTLMPSQKDLTECIVVHHQRFIDVSRHGNSNAFFVLMKIEKSSHVFTDNAEQPETLRKSIKV